ncbi:MAG: FlgO family outer membrane protein [Candidatus Poribacteria bacterium]|nr:FlgO family outer membrane protein [Candidatus Poribacteria bacterium]
MKPQSHAIFSVLLCFALLTLAQTGIAAENNSLRDIAVAKLKNESGNSELDQYCQSIPDTIFTQLAGSQKLSLVERNRLEDALNEMGLAEIGIADPKGAAQVGNAIGARHIFVGTLFKEGTEIVINTRLIDVESSQVIGGWSERATLGNLNQVSTNIAQQILDQLFPSSPFSAALKSTVIPGWGQLSNNRVSGYIFLIGGLASLGGLVATQLSLNSEEDNLDELNILSRRDLTVTGEERRSLQKAEDDVDDKRNTRNIAAIVFGSVWGLNIIDAYIETHLLVKSRQSAVGRTMTFHAMPDLQGLVVQVRF